MGLKEILIAATNTDRYQQHHLATGLWLSELTHLYDAAKERGYNVTIASPLGGAIPIDPESLKPFLLDGISRKYWGSEAFRHQLNNSVALSELGAHNFDLVYLAGGHGTMYDFPNNTDLQRIIARHYEAGKLVSAICHGVGGLLNVRLSDGKYLIEGKQMTGFSWFEERLARRKSQVPFNLEAELLARQPKYSKAFIPMTSRVVRDGLLITGQNPFSSKEMAQVVMQALA